MSYRVTQSQKSLDEFKKAITDAQAHPDGNSHVYLAETGSPYAMAEVDVMHPGVTFESMYIPDWSGTSTQTGKPVTGALVTIAHVDPGAVQHLDVRDNPQTRITTKLENGHVFSTSNHFMRGQSETITLLKTVKVHEDPVGAEQAVADVILQISGQQQMPLDTLAITSKHGVIKGIHYAFSEKTSRVEIEQYFKTKGLTRPDWQSDEYLRATVVEGQFHSDQDKMQGLDAMPGKQALRETGYTVGGMVNGRSFADTYAFVEGAYDANKNGTLEVHETQKLGVFLVGKGEDIYTDDCKQPVVCKSDKLIAHLLEGADRDHWDPASNDQGKSGVVHKSFFASTFVVSPDGNGLLNQADVENIFSRQSVNSGSHSVASDSHATLTVVYRGAVDKVIDGKILPLHHYEAVWQTRSDAANIVEGQFETNHWELRLKDGKKIQFEAVVEGNVDSAPGQSHTVTENDPVMPGVHDEEIEEIDENGIPVQVPNALNPLPNHAGRSRRSIEPSDERMDDAAGPTLPRFDDNLMSTAAGPAPELSRHSPLLSSTQSLESNASGGVMSDVFAQPGATDILNRLLGDSLVPVI